MRSHTNQNVTLLTPLLEYILHTFTARLQTSVFAVKSGKRWASRSRNDSAESARRTESSGEFIVMSYSDCHTAFMGPPCGCSCSLQGRYSAGMNETVTTMIKTTPIVPNRADEMIAVKKPNVSLFTDEGNLFEQSLCSSLSLSGCRCRTSDRTSRWWRSVTWRRLSVNQACCLWAALCIMATGRRISQQEALLKEVRRVMTCVKCFAPHS